MGKKRWIPKGRDGMLTWSEPTDDEYSLYAEYLRSNPEVLLWLDSLLAKPYLLSPDWIAQDNLFKATTDDAEYRDGIDAGELPEVIVMPDEDTEKIRNRMHIMFLGLSPEARLKIYELLGRIASAGSNEFLSRLWNIYNMSKSDFGYPTSSSDRFSKFSNMIDKLTSGRDDNPSSYIPVTNLMYNIQNLDDYVSELSHAFLFNAKAARKAGVSNRFSLDELVKMFTRRQEENYYIPGTIERDAHFVVLPVLERYLIGDLELKDISDYIKSYKELEQ